MNIKINKSCGYRYQQLGPIDKNYPVQLFTNYVETILVGDYYDTILMPYEGYKINAVRAFTNEQFALGIMRYLPELEDFYFRNLTDMYKQKILKCVFKEVTSGTT